MKQTAVEWLEEFMTNGKQKSIGIISLACAKAKEMEKQQIIEAHGNKLKKSKGVTNYEYWLSGEEYYKETFKP
jgi:hypothetical protein